MRGDNDKITIKIDSSCCNKRYRLKNDQLVQILNILEDINEKNKNDKKNGDGLAFIKEDGSVWQQKWKNGVLISNFKTTTLKGLNFFLFKIKSLIYDEENEQFRNGKLNNFYFSKFLEVRRLLFRVLNNNYLLGIWLFQISTCLIISH